MYTALSESKNAKAAHFTLPERVATSMQRVIKEWKTKDPGQDKFHGTAREILRIDFPGPVHGIQEIAFNPRASKVDPDYGMLYIGVGDGGSVVNGHPDIALHYGSGILGTILRIDPTEDNSENGNYGIPKDNPFIKDLEKKNEIWAYGFRSPNRMAWNLEGNLFVSDIGHKIVEEVNAVLPGKFYGWPIREGKFVIDPFGNQSLAFPLPENDEDLGITYPIIQYDHDEGAAISGGFFAKKGDFDGKYIFGDIPQGNAFLADSFLKNQAKVYKLNISLKGQKTDFHSLVQNNRVDLIFGQDCDGIIYMLTKADGKIYKMIQD